MPENHPMWPDQPTEEVEPDLLIDDTLVPPDHRSGFVTVVGRPNVGKSTLMNAYLEQKVAIVSDVPQTTRNRLLGILTLPQAQIIFIDTPGIHQPHHKLGQILLETATRAIPDADIVLWLVDGAEPPQAEDKLVAETLARLRRRPFLVLALNKTDLLAPDQIEAQLQRYAGLLEPDRRIAISATTGYNRAALLDMVIERLPLGPRYFPEDQVTDVHIRFIAAEMIREAALLTLQKEVPHALAIEVEEFKERSPTMTYISAIICVERDSQKPIVIGKRGQTLKRIGQLARREIETLMETQIYLDLRVKIRRNWRKREKLLHQLGYGMGR